MAIKSWQECGAAGRTIYVLGAIWLFAFVLRILAWFLYPHHVVGA